MTIGTFYGPDRRALPADDLATFAQERRPFHGIVSGGLLKMLRSTEGSIDWARHSVWLEPALAGDSRAVQRIPPELLRAAKKCSVLRLHDSAAVARKFVEEELQTILVRVYGFQGQVDLGAVELWNVKEGHTSSVWRASGFQTSPGVPSSLAINVARDAIAGEELVASAIALEELRQRVLSMKTARVLAKANVRIKGRNAPAVAVVAQEWVDDALELGILTDRSSGTRRFCAIERFLTGVTEPGRIVAIRGRRLDLSEHESVVRDIVSAMLEGAAFDLSNDQVVVPAFEINEGDWVFIRKQARLVALSPRQDEFRIGEALGHFLFHLTSKYRPDEEARITCLRAAQSAVEAFCDAKSGLSLVDWRTRAKQVPPERWRELGLGEVTVAMSGADDSLTADSDRRGALRRVAA